MRGSMSLLWRSIENLNFQIATTKRAAPEKIFSNFPFAHISHRSRRLHLQLLPLLN